MVRTLVSVPRFLINELVNVTTFYTRGAHISRMCRMGHTAAIHVDSGSEVPALSRPLEPQSTVKWGAARVSHRLGSSCKVSGLLL